MSANPRLVPEALTLDALTYDEAMELAYFGAKVIHPSTMGPAVERGLPIFIRNTFKPEFAGTRIAADASSAFAVKGLATIEDLALLNLEGTGMIGVPGTAQRLFGLDAWRETPYYSDRERATLAWTECLTRLPADGAPNAMYQSLEAAFTAVEIANLNALIGVINLWNRIAVGLNWPMPRAA